MGEAWPLQVDRPATGKGGIVQETVYGHCFILYMSSLGYIRTHSNSLEPTRTRSNSPELSRTH